MQLFSKRYNSLSLRRLSITEDRGERTFIKDTLRKRLQFEIKFIIATGEYLEPVLQVNNKIEKTIYLHAESLRNLSMAELGYDITQILNCASILFFPEGEGYSDPAFFDLIELILIFSKSEKRQELINRIKRIFEEENSEFTINAFMIVSKRETGLRAIIPIIKEPLLKKKLEEYYENRVRANYETLARTSADIIQYIFSSPSDKQDTKVYSENLAKSVSSKWTQKDNIEELTKLLNSGIKLAKDFNNQISNIRHTDKHTIPVEGSSFYKLIAMNNISIIELVIQSLPETYILDEDPEDLKKEYLTKYKLLNHAIWIVKPKEEEVAPDDIPF